MGRLARDSRLLNWIPALVLVAGVAAYAATRVVGSNPSTPPAPKAAPVDPASVRVAREFLATAVARRNLAASYDLVAPALKQDLTLAQWKSGTIPVVPYPVADATTSLKPVSSFTGAVLFRVTLTPRPGSSAKPGLFDLSERKLGGRWLVDGWTSASGIAAPSSK
jgi:hypothetical protein